MHKGQTDRMAMPRRDADDSIENPPARVELAESNNTSGGRAVPDRETSLPPLLFPMPFGWDARLVEAGFTGRAGGCSPAPYASLNLSFSRRDAVEHVLENHRRVACALGCRLSDMVRARQTHGSRVALVQPAQGGISEQVDPALDGVDALITNAPELVLLTSHADCVPVYFHDAAHGAIGLAHAGWGGVLAGVVEETVVAMTEAFGTNPTALQVGIGPHIGACCFEVQADVLDRFQQMDWWDASLLHRKGAATHVDLDGCICAILTGCGVPVASITSAGICTRCEGERFFSHRGSGGHTGTGSAWLRLRCLLSMAALCLTLVLSACAELPALSSLPGFPGSADPLTAGAVTMEPVEEVEPQSGTLPGMGEVLLEDNGPERGGTLRLFMRRTDAFDPLNTLDPEVVDAGWFLSDALVTLLPSGRIVPQVAEEIRSSQDGLVWDLTLREGVRFHDGTLLEAEDAAASIRHAAAATQGVYAKGLASLVQVEIIDRHRIRLVLSVPDPLLTRHLTFPLFASGSWRTSEDGEVFTPVGLGAYQFDAVSEEGVSLIRFDDWWQAAEDGPVGHPAWPDTVLFLFGDSEADRITFFQQRRIDAAWAVDADTSRYASRTDIEVRTFAGNRMEFILVGGKSAMLKTEALRAIVLRYLAGRLAETPQPGDAVAYAGESPLTAEEAVSLLEAAGCKLRKKGEAPSVLSYPGPYGLRDAVLTIGYNALSVKRLTSAEWISDSLREIGISCYLQEMPTTDAEKLVANGQFDMLLLGGQFPEGTPDDDMPEWMRTSLPETVADLLPLYRERRAMLYSTRIRGDKHPTGTHVYEGWQNWYLLSSKGDGETP